MCRIFATFITLATMRFICSLLLLLSVCTLSARDTLRLSKTEAEAYFLANNLPLIAEKLQIASEQATVVQAGLWPNPVFSVSEINAWATPRQTGGEAVSPPFWGAFGRNQQVAFELEQLIQTAGKRKKLVAIKELDVSRAEEYFRDLLRGLKYELRNTLTQAQYLQHAREAHQALLVSIGKLTDAYGKQLADGHVSQAEYVRLRAMEIDVRKSVLDLEGELAETHKELRLLLRLPASVRLQLHGEGFVREVEPYSRMAVGQLLETAKASRPDYQLARLAEKQSAGLLAYERAQRVPDLAFHVNYDRNGNTMLDFVGFGISFDLPVFNRNQGNIRKAELAIDRTAVQTRETILAIENEVVMAFDDLQRHIEFAKQIEPDYEETLDRLLERYTANFSARRVSLLEYIDFLQAYLNNKNMVLKTHKAINNKIEALNFSLGMDLPDLP